MQPATRSVLSNALQHKFITESGANRSCMVEALEQVRKITSERGYRLLDDEDAEQMDVRCSTPIGVTAFRHWL